MKKKMSTFDDQLTQIFRLGREMKASHKFSLLIKRRLQQQKL